MREKNKTDWPILTVLSHLWFELTDGGNILMGRMTDSCPWIGRRMFMRMTYIDTADSTYIEFKMAGAINGKGLIRAVATHQTLPAIPHESMILLVFSGPQLEHF